MTTTVLPPGVRELTFAGALSRHARTGPTALISLTDEELLALIDDPDGSSVHLPWVTAQESSPAGFDRTQARLSALRSLLARGVVGPESAVAATERRAVDGDPSRLVATGLVTGIITRRRAAVTTVEMVDETVARGALSLHVDRDGTTLQEQVSTEGLHHFTMLDVTDATRSARTFCAPGLPVPGDDAASTAGARDGAVWTGPRDGFRTDPDLLRITGEILSCTHVTVQGEAGAGDLWILTTERSLLLAQPAASAPEEALDAVPLQFSELEELLDHVLTAAVPRS
jgi:hypothetical protein